MNNSWATLFYIVGIYGLVRFLAKPPKDLDSKTVNWTPLESVGITIFIYFFGQLIGGLMVYAIPLLFGWGESQIVDWVSNDAIGQFITICTVDAISVFLLLKFLKKRKNNVAILGLVKQVKWSDLFYAIGTYILYFVVFLFVIQIATSLFPAIDVEQKQQIGFDTVSQWKLPLVFISLVILPAVVEELLIRGFLYGGLREKIPKIFAVFLTSFIFAVAHLQFGSGEKLLWVAAIDTFVLSIFLIMLREKTGRLWSSIMLHGIKNSVAFVSLFILKII